MNEELKWYQKSWAIWLLIFVFWPVGLYLLWKYGNYSKTTKLVVTGFIAISYLILFKNNNSQPNQPTVAITQQEQKSEPVQKQVEVLHPEIQKISAVPSIGATRVEFEKYHKQNASNSVSDIRYDNDNFIVTFVDSTGNDSADKNNRAFMVYIQKENTTDEEIKMFIPSDATDLKVTNQYSDNMMTSIEFEGKSEMLAQVYPKSGGSFGFGTVQNKQTGKFISATFMINIPLSQ